MALTLEDPTAQRTDILRYALGATVGVVIAITFGGLMGYMLPLLALPFLAAKKTLGLAEGLGFIIVMGLAVLTVNFVILFFVDYPAVLLLVFFLLIFHILYTEHKLMPPPVKILFLVSLLTIPNLATKSVFLAQGVSLGLFIMSLGSVVFCWIMYYFLPARANVPVTGTATPAPASVKLSEAQRFRAALTRTLVIFPAVLLFYFVELTSALVVLVYISILATQKGFGKGFNEGKFLILGNVGGGLLAIGFYEMIVMVPNLVFYFVLLLLIALYIAKNLFGPSPAAPLFGTAFTTFILVVGATTSFGSTDAGTKTWLRVTQILMAVIYIAVTFGFIYKWRNENSEKQ